MAKYYQRLTILTFIIYANIGIYHCLDDIEKQKDFYKESEEYALDLIDIESDLSFLAEFLKQTTLPNNPFFKKVAMTLFAPTNQAFKNILIPPSHLLNLGHIPDSENVINTILLSHIIPGRLINPQSLGKEATVYKSKSGQDLKLHTTDTPDKAIYISSNGFECRVTGIIKAKRGYIYKIDHVLTHKWSPGPPIIDYIRKSDIHYKMQYLLKALQSEAITELNRSGPVTIFLIPDSGWVFHGRKTVPKCVFDSLAKPENSELVNSVMQTIALPGIYKKTDIQELSWLPVISAPPQLAVAHVQQCDRASKAYLAKPCEKLTFIEGHQIIEWDIPIMNGVAHILSEAIITPENEQRITDTSFWNCTNQFCRECPNLLKIMLKYLDEDGLLPMAEPFQWTTPPGVRPDWVCRGINGYYPAGWTYLTWETHVKSTKKNVNNKLHETALIKAAKKKRGYCRSLRYN